MNDNIRYGLSNPREKLSERINKEEYKSKQKEELEQKFYKFCFDNPKMKYGQYKSKFNIVDSNTAFDNYYLEYIYRKRPIDYPF